MPGKRLSFEGGDTPAALMFRIIPVTLMFFGIVWCMWYVRRTNQQARQPAAGNDSAPHEDPIDLEKRRALIEARLVTRKVLSKSPEGTISYSDPIVATLTSEPVKSDEVHVTCINNDTGLTSDCNNEMSLCEDEEQPLPPPERCQETDAQSLPSLSSDQDGPTSPRDNDNLRSSVRSHGSRLRRPSLVRMLSSALQEFSERDHSPCCDICLMEYDEGDLVCSSPNEACVHVYHRECILDWTTRNPNCPVCRRNYVGDEAV